MSDENDQLNVTPEAQAFHMPDSRGAESAQNPEMDRGIAELLSTLDNPDFQNNYAELAASEVSKKIAAVGSEIGSQVAKARKETVDKLAFESLQQAGKATTIEEAQALKKDWGMARKQAETDNKSTLDASDAELRQKLTVEHQAEIDSLNSEKQAVVARAMESAKAVAAEAHERTNDPLLRQALEVWGQSPNAKSDRGADGKGFNAGVVHYFEYRADPDKNSRFAHTGAQAEMSVDGFIQFSNDIQGMMRDAEATKENAALIHDAEGNRRLFVVTDKFGKEETVVGFQRAGVDKTMKAISFLPKDKSQFEKTVAAELNPKPGAPARLNELGSVRTLE